MKHWTQRRWDDAQRILESCVSNSNATPQHVDDICESVYIVTKRLAILTFCRVLDIDVNKARWEKRVK